MKYYLLEADDDPSTGSEISSRDLPRNETAKALIFDITAQQSSATAATRVNLAAQIDQIRIGAAESNRVSEIDGEDLDAFNVLNGNEVNFDSSAADNARVSLGYVYPFDPFCLSPEVDFNQPFGISGNVARKVEIAYAADGSNIDDKRVAIGIVTSPTATSGYVAFHRDAYTVANAVNNFTDVPQPGKLLGVFNFETTSAADVTSDGVHRTGQTIQEQAITINRKDVLGHIYPTTAAAMSGNYTANLTDTGYSFWNLGFTNKVGGLGVPSGSSEIPQNMEIRTKGGSSADATRVYAVTLNTNV